MSMERLKAMKEVFMCAVEGQMHNLSEVDAEELGEVVDMIKDLEEAMYYCAVVKAMEGEDGEHREKAYYTDPMYGTYSGDWYQDRRYYGDGKGTHLTSTHSNGGMKNGTSYYSEKEYPQAFDDPREGKSYRSRRMYMEAKETHQDKTTQMKELEKYAQELTADIIEMVEDASPEERQYLSKKVIALANKITQLNSNG
jgi:hypothetical protein